MRLRLSAIVALRQQFNNISLCSLTRTFRRNIKCDMVLVSTYRVLPARVVIAAVVACLIVLQSFALAASPAFAGSARDPVSHSAAISADGGHCDAPRGDKAPAQGHCDHSHCCILCRADGRDASSVIIAASLVVLVYSAPEASLSAARFTKNDFVEHPIGWTSSWSSRAPPAIS